MGFKRYTAAVSRDVTIESCLRHVD